MPTAVCIRLYQWIHEQSDIFMTLGMFEAANDEVIMVAGHRTVCIRR